MKASYIPKYLSVFSQLGYYIFPVTLTLLLYPEHHPYGYCQRTGQQTLI